MLYALCECAKGDDQCPAKEAGTTRASEEKLATHWNGLQNFRVDPENLSATRSDPRTRFHDDDRAVRVHPMNFHFVQASDGQRFMGRTTCFVEGYATFRQDERK